MAGSDEEAAGSVEEFGVEEFGVAELGAEEFGPDAPDPDAPDPDEPDDEGADELLPGADAAEPSPEDVFSGMPLPSILGAAGTVTLLVIVSAA